AAAVYQEQDGERQAVLAEVRYLLRQAVLVEREVLALHPSDDAPRLLLEHERVEDYQINVHPDDFLAGARLFGARLDDARARLRRWCRPRVEGEGERQYEQDGHKSLHVRFLRLLSTVTGLRRAREFLRASLTVVCKYLRVRA